MFPINLQKNIDQLGRQISLLENECKNIEMEKKRRTVRAHPSFGGKASDTRVKPSVVKIAAKKANSSKKLRKSTPPVSARPSAGPHCTKTWSENGCPDARKKGFTVPVDSSEFLSGSQISSRRENKCQKCVCCTEAHTTDLGHGDSTNRGQKGHVLHRELVFADSGSTIEVTVTQKPNSAKENVLSCKHKSPRKIVNSEKDIEGELQDCRCHGRGQKWAEILCSDLTKKSQMSSMNSGRNRIADETKTIDQGLSLNNQKDFDVKENHNNNIKPYQKKDMFEVPVKLPSQCYITKQQSEINTNKFDKETQCSLEKQLFGEHLNDMYDPKDKLNTLKYLINQILQRPTDESGKLTISTETLKKFQEAQKESEEKNNTNPKTSSQSNALCKNFEKPNCENLKKEKEILSQELAAKDNVIATLRKREDEYVTLISNLKTTLEKTKGNAQETADAVKEINFLRTKLMQQIKVSEALKQNHTRMQEIVEQCTLENDKLKTEIKIFKLEAQKHEVLMAGKEAQINRYKEEIQNFQRQISEHLASLKTNAAQGIDIEKMMEAIVEQTQIFNQGEEVSALVKNPKGSSDLQNALIHSTPHSSPTSAKTSIVNSSWKRISSIHGHDLSRANSDFGIYLNDDENQKDFFEIFGGEGSKSKVSKKSREPSVEELLEKKDVKRSSSFTSCITMEDDQKSTKSSNRPSSITKESVNSVEQKLDEELKKDNRVSLKVAQSNIEKLLKNMKLKFSKEIFDTSLPSCSTEDFLEFSQISSMSPVQ